MDQRPEQLPEGELVARAQKRLDLSSRKAAPLAGISEGRWRQIVNGYQNVGSGVYAPVRAPADTLARMAHVVGVTAQQLDEAGRPDAAEELRTLELTAPAPDLQGDMDERADAIISNGPLLSAIIRRLAAQGPAPLPPRPESDAPDQGQTGTP